MSPYLVFGAFGVVIAIVLGTGWVIRGTIARAERRTTALCPAPLQTGRANGMGHTAPSPQVRGLGVLAYNHQQLVFAAGIRNRVLIIPRADIIAATASDSFSRPGKAVRTTKARVLTVEWNVDGVAARAGWQMPDAATAEKYAQKLRRTPR